MIYLRFPLDYCENYFRIAVANLNTLTTLYKRNTVDNIKFEDFNEEVLAQFKKIDDIAERTITQLEVATATCKEDSELLSKSIIDLKEQVAVLEAKVAFLHKKHSVTLGMFASIFVMLGVSGAILLRISSFVFK